MFGCWILRYDLDDEWTIIFWTSSLSAWFKYGIKRRWVIMTAKLCWIIHKFLWFPCWKCGERISHRFLYQMVHLICCLVWVCPDSFALMSLHTGKCLEKILHNSCWKSLYMKLSIFPRDTFFYFFSKML